MRRKTQNQTKSGQNKLSYFHISIVHSVWKFLRQSANVTKYCIIVGSDKHTFCTKQLNISLIHLIVPDKQFLVHNIVITFLSISLNICFGHSNEPSHVLVEK